MCGGNTATGGMYTKTSVFGGENTTGSVYNAQNTMGSAYSAQSTMSSAYTTTSVHAGHNTTTYSDEAFARTLKARLRQACENFSKSVWVEECDTV